MKRFLALSVIGATLAVGAAGAQAATKVVDSRAHNFSVDAGQFDDELCGVATRFESTWEFGQLSTVVWDNGHSFFSFTFRDYIADTVTGTVIATTTASHVELEGPGTLPFSGEHNVAATCTPASGMPGHEITLVTGLTFNEQGILTEVHVKEIIP